MLLASIAGAAERKPERERYVERSWGPKLLGVLAHQADRHCQQPCVLEHSLEHTTGVRAQRSGGCEQDNIRLAEQPLG